MSRVELSALLKDKLDAEFFWKFNETRLDNSVIGNDSGAGTAIANSVKIQKLTADVITLYESYDKLKNQMITTCATQSQIKELQALTKKITVNEENLEIKMQN